MNTDFLVHVVYANFLITLPSFLLAYLISWQVFKAVFKNRDVSKWTVRIVTFVGAVALTYLLLDVGSWE